VNLLVKEYEKLIHICQLYDSLLTVIQQQFIINDTKTGGIFEISTFTR